MHGRSDGNSHLLFDFTRRGLMNVGEVVVEHDRDVWILSLRGEHDLATTPNLRDELERALGGDSRVVVDLSEVEFIDSTVLASLTHGYERAKNSDPPTMAIVCPEGGVAHRLLALVGLDETIPNYGDRDGAVAALLGG
jgi:anti-sigma B factor antagonist